MEDLDRKAEDHRCKARQYLQAAQENTDPDRRQELLNLCEQEMAAAAAIRQGSVEPRAAPRIDRREGFPAGATIPRGYNGWLTASDTND